MKKHKFLANFPVRECYIKTMNIYTMADISEAVKNRRKSLGLTQAECAAMCNVGKRFFSEVENGKESLHIGKVLICLPILRIDIFLINREDTK